MKRFAIALLFLLCSCTAFANITTETLVADCKDYVKAQDNGKTTYDSSTQAQAASRCIGYVKGFMDESQGEAFARSGSNIVLVGTWQNITADQEIRVFVKYVVANPESLNKDAVFTLRESADSAGLYKYHNINDKE